jgi:alkylation response protein AidB-like acyl-CoA dehydrogenase
MPYDFDPTDEARMIRDMVRKFAEERIKPVAKELDAKEEFSPALTKEMGNLGLFGFCVPEQYGGNGFGYIPYIIAVEELARIDASQAATVAAHNSLGIGPIYYFGSDDQKRELLPKLCTGERLWGFGLTEPNAGSDAGGSKTNAVLKDGQWILNGSKIFITNGAGPSSLGCTVQAVSGKKDGGKKEYTCFLVRHSTKGFEGKLMHNKMMWRASITSELYMDDCAVSEKDILGSRGDGFKQMLSTLDRGRLSIGAMGLGCAQGAYELGLKYAKERKQFGEPISSFQLNAAKLADMHTEIESARLLLYKAAWLCDQKRAEYKKFAAMAKLKCSEVAHMCANHALQLHGGYGLMKDYDIERFYRDQKLLEIGEGTSEIQRLVIARHIGCFEK